MTSHEENKDPMSQREPPSISQDRLHACLEDQYALSPAALEFLPLGHDYNAGVYRVVSKQGTAYLLKVSSRPLYEPACLVPRYLHEQGVNAVVAPLPTKSGSLWATLEQWTVLVYPFLEGDTDWNGMTPAQWKEAGAIFRRIHQSPLPPEGFASLRQETFDPTAYTRWVRAFENDHLPALREGSAPARAVCASWVAHQATIATGVATLEKLAAALQARPLPRVICHADLHAANLLRDRAGRVFVLDWDEVMLAPKERDFIFIRGPHAEAFWEGYGQRDVDWTALTYYLWERVVQDLIEYAQGACFRDDWSEETRAEAAQWFEVNLAGRSNSSLAAAYAAAAHLAP
jgi:spectinomycin phosphotransferase